MSFLETVARAKGYLQEHGRVSLSALKLEFELDDARLESLVEELVDVQQVVAREGKVLSWIGVASPPEQETRATAEAPSEPTEAPTAAEAERRQLTVLFCDLVDSTRLASGLDPEDWREVVRGYQQSAAEVIGRLDGYVAQYLGDGLLVYFGYPKAHEDDAERAVRAGLGIVEAIAEGDARLAVRIGIHTGPVVVGEMGGGASRETLAMGDTMNVAARIEGEAEPDTVALSSATLRLVSGIFVTENLGERPLKGAGDVHLHRALRASGMRSRLDVAAATGLTPLVGRDQELGLLDDRFAQVADGIGQAVLVSGEAGIGKSRLVQAFRERIAERAHSWLECRCSPYTQDSALFPVLELQRQGLGLAADTPPEVRIERLEAGLKRAGFDLAHAMPLMASFHGLALPEHSDEPVLSPEGRRKKTLDLLVEWLLRLGRLQPLVLLMEDLHWMDPSTQELLGQILERIPRENVLLLATYRPDFEPPWGAKSHLTPMQLARLTRPQLGDLIRKAARQRDLPEEWIDEIVRRSDGVPLFAEELTRTVLESHPEPPAGGVVPELHIPESLQDSLMARLDALGPVKELAQLGSVLGREFDYALLLSVSPMKEADLEQALAAAVREELFYQRGTPPKASYLFKHALTRDAAYQSLLRATRQRHHRRVAETLIDRMPELAEAQPELVAHHLTEADDTDRAITYWQRAGERATQRMESSEAIRHLRKGLELVERTPAGRERDARELQLQMSIGAPLMALEGYSSAECGQAYGRARELCRQIGEAPELYQALFGLALHYNTGGQLRTASEVAQELLDLAQRSGDTAHLVLGHVARGLPFFDQGEMAQSLQHLDRTIALYDPSRHRALAASYGFDLDTGPLCFTARAIWQLGHPDRALARLGQAIERGRESPYSQSLAQALALGSIVHQLRRECAEVKRRAEEAIAVSEDQGLPVFLGVGKVMRGWAAADEGAEEGLGELQEGLALLAQTGTQLGAPMILGLLAEAQRSLGRGDEALGTLDSALGIAEANDNRFWNAELLRIKGELLLEDATRANEGESCLRQAVELAHSKQWCSFELRAATSLARLWQRQDKRAEARDLLAPVYDWFTEGFDTQDLKEARTLLDELS